MVLNRLNNLAPRKRPLPGSVPVRVNIIFGSRGQGGKQGAGQEPVPRSQEKRQGVGQSAEKQYGGKILPATSQSKGRRRVTPESSYTKALTQRAAPFLRYLVTSILRYSLIRNDGGGFWGFPYPLYPLHPCKSCLRRFYKNHVSSFRTCSFAHSLSRHVEAFCYRLSPRLRVTVSPRHTIFKLPRLRVTVSPRHAIFKLPCQSDSTPLVYLAYFGHHIRERMYSSR